jgi:hypothetical protein
MDDYRQQQELEAERIRRELDALMELKKCGKDELADFFAAELGITKEFQQEVV